MRNIIASFLGTSAGYYTYCASQDLNTTTRPTPSKIDTAIRAEIINILFRPKTNSHSLTPPAFLHNSPSIQNAITFLHHSSKHLFILGSKHTGKTSLLSAIQYHATTSGDVVIEISSKQPFQSLSNFLCDKSWVLKLGRRLPFFGIDDTFIFQTFLQVSKQECKRRQSNSIDGKTLPNILLLLDNDNDLQQTLDWIQALKPSKDKEDAEIKDTPELDWIQVLKPSKDKEDVEIKNTQENNGIVRIVSASTYVYHHRETQNNVRELCVQNIVPVVDSYGVLHLPNTIALLPDEEAEADQNENENENTTESDTETNDSDTINSTHVHVNLPRLTSYHNYLNEMLSSSSIILDEIDVKDVLKTVGSSYFALSTFVQQRCNTTEQSSTTTTAACDAVLNNISFTETLFPDSSDEDDIHSRCQFRALSALSSIDLVAGSDSGGGGGGGSGLADVLGSGTREEMQGAPSVRWQNGSALLDSHFEHRLEEFQTAVGTVGYLNLRFHPHQKVGHVLTMNVENNADMEHEEDVVLPIQCFSVEACNFDLSTLYSRAFQRYISDERRGNHYGTDNGWLVDQQIGRLEALVHRRYAEEDLLECHQDMLVLEKEETITKEAWERANVLKNDNGINDKELLRVQLKLDQRKSRERTSRYELERRTRRIEVQRLDAVRVLDRYKSIRDGSRN